MRWLAVLWFACGEPVSSPEPKASKVTVDAAVARPDTIAQASPKAGSGSGSAVVPVETVDGEALRKANRARIAADTSPVTIVQGGTARELGRRICEAVVPKRPASTPVLIKPNMSGFNWFKNPAKTGGDNGVTNRIADPEFVRGVIRCLVARGHSRITVADGFTGKPSDWDRLMKVSGYAAMAADEKVTLVALDDDGVYDKREGEPGKPLAITGIAKSRVPTLLMPKAVADHLKHGLYISIPKLKTHRYSVFSLGIKGMQGTVMYSDAAPAYKQKWRTHKEIAAALELVKQGDPKAREVYVKSLEIFAARMVDILELEAPHVVLVEGAPGMTGDGFDQLTPLADHVAIGGTNVIAVDRVGAEYLGLWDSEKLAAELGGHRTSPLLTAAAKRFGVDITRPKVVGDGAELLAKRRPGHLIGMADFTVDERDSGPP